MFAIGKILKIDNFMIDMNTKQKLKNITAIAFPIMLSNLILFTCILINTGILGDFNKSYFYYLAIFTPVNYFMMAIYESLRITSLSICQANNSNKYRLLPYVKSLIILGTILIVACAIFYILLGLSDYFFGLGFVKNNKILYLFILSMILSGIPIAYNSVFNGILYAIGKQKIALLFMGISSISVCVLSYLFVYNCNLGIFSLSAAEIIAFIMPLLITFYIIKNNDTQSAEVKKHPETFKLSLQFVKNIGIPTSCVYIVIFIGLFCYNIILNKFGEDIVSAFSIVLRIQNVVMIPAIAVGVSVGIIINRLFSENDYKKAISYLETSFFFILLIYLIASILIFILGEHIVRSFVTNFTIEKKAIECLKYFSISYIGLGVMLMFVCILEQTGRNKESLLTNIIVFATQIIVGGMFAITMENYLYFYWSIILINFLSLFYVMYKVFLHKEYRSNLSKLTFIV